MGDVIRSGTSEEVNVLGHTPNVASRLQELADPNSVVVSAVTESVARRRFHFAPKENVNIKGVTGPSRVFKVVGRIQNQETLVKNVDSQHFPLVGRLHEIGLLEDRWRSAEQGEGQVVVLSGEAGIGKSRVAETLYGRARGHGILCSRLICSSYYSNSALHPIVEFARDKAGIDSSDTANAKFRKLDRFLESHSITDDMAKTLFAELLLIEAGSGKLSDISSERKKDEIFALSCACC